MTIAEVEKEVRNVIEKHSVYGLETILFALVRSTKGKPHMDKECCIELLKKSAMIMSNNGEISRNASGRRGRDGNPPPDDGKPQLDIGGKKDETTNKL